MDEPISQFAAKEPSLGYFYQIRYSLYLLLSNRDLEDPKLRIENLDDIEIESIERTQIYQTKLKMKSKANLSDSSVDFWKTIRVWADNISNNRVDSKTTIFSLISTEQASPSSFISVLKNRLKTEIQVKDVIRQMDVIATTSTNETNKKAYEEYLGLTMDHKINLIKNIHVIDSECDIEEITKNLRAELALSCQRNHIESLLEILEGWWFQNAIELLLGKKDCITFDELQYKVASLRDSFSLDNLPNHFSEQLEISDQDIIEFKDKTYLKQLEAVTIHISSNTAKRAISDFRRAYEQRSKWLRLDLLSPDEQTKYDERLYDHWKNLFDILQDECENEELEKVKEIGKQFYLNQFVKNCPQIKIRERFNEDYLTRGSYQILSDEKRIGWHPKYKDLI